MEDLIKKSDTKSDTTKTKTKSSSKDNGKNVSKEIGAVQENLSVPKSNIFKIALSCIVGTDNYRQEPANLASLGYHLVNTEDVDHSLIHMCLSKDMDTVRAAVALFEEHEGYQSDEDDNLRVATPATSIVSLARKIDQVGQLQPVSVRPIGNTEKYSIVFGQRRVAAMAYRHAKSRMEIADGVKTKIIPAVVNATVDNITAEEAWNRSVAENSDRKNNDPIQEGMIYSRLMERTDPDTGFTYTLSRASELLGVNRNRMRSYIALTKPRDEDSQTGLTDEDRELIRSGDKTVTWGIRRALNEHHYSDGTPKGTRDRPIPMKAMMELFDNSDETNTERRRAIAECMGFPATDDGYNEAVKRSEQRIADQENKKPRGRRKKQQQETVEEN